MLANIVLCVASLPHAVIHLHARLCCFMQRGEHISLQGVLLHAAWYTCRAAVTKLVMQIGLYSIAFGFSWGPIGWLLPSEIHDLNTRSAGQSITVFTQLMSGAVVTQSSVTAHNDCNDSFMLHVVPPPTSFLLLLLPPLSPPALPVIPIILHLHPILDPSSSCSRTPS